MVMMWAVYSGAKWVVVKAALLVEKRAAMSGLRMERLKAELLVGKKAYWMAASWAGC